VAPEARVYRLVGWVGPARPGSGNGGGRACLRQRTIAFSKEWRGETREAAESQSFWNNFFNFFGVRCATASQEVPFCC
jgi:hypothetical protein